MRISKMRLIIIYRINCPLANLLVKGNIIKADSDPKPYVTCKIKKKNGNNILAAFSLSLIE